jgi:hypothetical protein
MRLVSIVMIAVVVAAGGALAADVAKSVVDPYLQTQTALADDGLSGAKAGALALATAADKLGPSAAPLAAAARKLAGAENLEAARDAFLALTEALLKYAEATHSTLGSDVKLAWCPMNQKTWVQKTDQEIANPYFGKAMRSCGDFKK